MCTTSHTPLRTGPLLHTGHRQLVNHGCFLLHSSYFCPPFFRRRVESTYMVAGASGVAGEGSRHQLAPGHVPWLPHAGMEILLQRVPSSCSGKAPSFSLLSPCSPLCGTETTDLIFFKNQILIFLGTGCRSTGSLGWLTRRTRKPQQGLCLPGCCLPKVGRESQLLPLVAFFGLTQEITVVPWPCTGRQGQTGEQPGTAGKLRAGGLWAWLCPLFRVHTWSHCLCPNVRKRSRLPPKAAGQTVLGGTLMNGRRTYSHEFSLLPAPSEFPPGHGAPTWWPVSL